MHQLPLLDALGCIPGCEVRLVCPLIVESSRAASGWSVPTTKNVEILSLDRDAMRWLDDDFGRSSWHIFSGLGVYPTLRQPYFAAIRKVLRVVAMTERPNESNPISNVLRELRYRWHALLWKNHIHSVVALGEITSDSLVRFGFDREKIIEFGYFPAIGQTTTIYNTDTNVDHPFEILVVATHEKWKRIDLILQAVAAQTKDCHLTIIGTGSLTRKLVNLSATLRFKHPITWIDRLPNAEVQQRMAQSDLLVLSSDYDGWGAVINEALGVGTPVICSSACGAKSLTKYGLPLQVFTRGDLSALNRALKDQISHGKPAPKDRQRARQLAEATISPRAAAQRLWEEFAKLEADKNGIRDRFLHT